MNVVQHFSAGLGACSRRRPAPSCPDGVTDIEHPAANDLPDQAVTPEEIIGGLKQLIARADARHLKIFGATLLPSEGEISHIAEGEAKRRAVNEWIRSGNAFDGVIDFEAVVRNPDHPTRVRLEYDSGDHGHLNDAGYRCDGGFD